MECTVWGSIKVNLFKSYYTDMEEQNQVILRTIRELLEEGKTGVAITVLNGLHPADAAEILVELTQEDRIKIFRDWDVHESSETLEEMSEEDQVELVGGLSPQLALNIIASMSPDDAVDLLRKLPEQVRESVLINMRLDLSSKLRRLLSHGEKTAGGLMTPEAVRMSEDLKVKEVLEELRKVPEQVEMVYYVYLQDHQEKLTGVISLRELIIADPERPVKEIMHTDLIYTGTDADQEEVARLIDRYDLLALPVLDKGGRLLGIVTVDDAMEVIEEEAKEDLYSLAGTWESEEQKEKRPVLATLKGRFPWLVGALIIELLVVGLILRSYSTFLQGNFSLILFFPAVMFIGGTASVLSSTNIIHRVLSEEASTVSFTGALLQELLHGVVLGALSALVLSLIAWGWEGEARVSWAIAISTFFSVVLASILGAVLPWSLKKTGADPAKASEPLMSTVMDLFSLLIYLNIAFMMV